MITWLIKHKLKDFLYDLKNMDVLDFGCGDARYKELIITNNKYTGVDVEISGFDKNKKIADVFWDNKTLPFNDETFDVIICTESLNQVDDINNTIKEIKRVLKKGGKIFVTMVFIFGEHDTPHDFTRYTSFGIKNIFKKNNLKILKYEKLLEGKKSIIQILESEFTRYLNEKCNKKFKLIYRLLFSIVLILIKFLFLILPKDIFYNLHTNNLIILEKWRK